jgi:hypothetical protein
MAVGNGRDASHASQRVEEIIVFLSTPGRSAKRP